MNKRMIRTAVLCAMLGLVITGVIGVGVYARSLWNRMETNQPEATAPSLQARRIEAITHRGRPTMPRLTIPEPSTPQADHGVIPLAEEKDKHFVNLLLVGQDADEGKGTRSDTMILCTFNRRDNIITLTSFLRDLYVTIPGYHKDRINAAFAYGGVELLDKTLYENFGIEVDGNVQVDFTHFQEIIDLLGGVTMELTAAEARFINKHVRDRTVTEGTHLLNGEQALAYVRNRKDVDGDFSRTNRQRKLMRALAQAYKSKKLPQMLGLLDDILPMISTDISAAELTSYALTLFPMLDSAAIKTQSIPVADGFRYANVDGKAVLLPDMEKNRLIIENMLT